MMKIMVDADLILDYLNYQKKAEDLINAIDRREIHAHITSVGLDKIRSAVEFMPNSEFAEELVSAIQEKFLVQPIEPNLIHQANELSSKDFESVVELICATNLGLGAVVTHHPEDFSGASLPVLSVDSLLKRQYLEVNIVGSTTWACSSFPVVQTLGQQTNSKPRSFNVFALRNPTLIVRDIRGIRTMLRLRRSPGRYFKLDRRIRMKHRVLNLRGLKITLFLRLTISSESKDDTETSNELLETEVPG